MQGPPARIISRLIGIGTELYCETSPFYWSCRCFGISVLILRRLFMEKGDVPSLVMFLKTQRGERETLGEGPLFAGHPLITALCTQSRIGFDPPSPKNPLRTPHAGI